VLSTVEVIKLATTNKLKAVHYVSTLSVMAVVPEDSSSPAPSPPSSSPGRKTSNFIKSADVKSPTDKLKSASSPSPSSPPTHEAVDIGKKAVIYEAAPLPPAGTSFHTCN
jgi:hypothetical protein